MLRLIVLAAAAGLASAQLRPQDAAITWWASPTCAGPTSGSTIVVVEQDVSSVGSSADSSAGGAGASARSAAAYVFTRH